MLEDICAVICIMCAFGIIGVVAYYLSELFRGD